MAGTSPYFRRSKSKFEDAMRNACREYNTRRNKTRKIEYEENHAVPTMKRNENDLPAVDKKNDNEIYDNVKIKKEIEDDSYEVYSAAVNTDNVKKEFIIKNEFDKEGGSQSDWVPKDWQLLHQNIKEMRKYRTAVVDNLGCERLSDEKETPEVKRFQTFTSLLLSAQTKDQVTAAAVGRLKEHGLTIPNIAKTPENIIGEIIKPVGFWQRKSQYLRKCAIICQESYNGDIPNDLEGLLSLPGFGPKMAHLCMKSAWGVMTGIGVDTHVHRISNRLGWVRKPTKTPENTRKELESWLPRSEWDEINILLVGFGQEICRPVGPHCHSCLNNTICPSAFKEDRSKKRVKKEEATDDITISPSKGKRQGYVKAQMKKEEGDEDSPSPGAEGLEKTKKNIKKVKSCKKMKVET